jgi:hypothetical protein
VMIYFVMYLLLILVVGLFDVDILVLNGEFRRIEMILLMVQQRKLIIQEPTKHKFSFISMWGRSTNSWRER